MKFFLIIILMILTACTSTPTQTSASFFNFEADTAILSADSTSEQIQRAMLESATKWTTIELTGTINWYPPPAQSYQEHIWIDLLNDRFRVELISIDGEPTNILKISDGTTIYDVNLITNQMQTFAYPDFARVGQYVVPLEKGFGYSHPMWGQMGTQLSEMAFAGNLAQTEGTFTALGIENIDGRNALVVDWTYIENSAPSMKFWLDTKTAVILKSQDFGKGGSTTLQGERVITQVIYNQNLDMSLFAAPTGLPAAVVPAQVGEMPLVTEAGSVSEQEAGELYFFLQPHQAGQSVQLARVAGICAFDSAKCPPLEIIKAPFPFNFTLSPLSWAQDGSKAAFAYADNPSGTPQKLFIFDPANNTWTVLAQFPYIDPPFWSPDGTWIAFRTQDGVGGEDVYVVRRDSSEMKSVSVNLPAAGKPYVMDGWYTENIIMRSAALANQGSIYLVRVSDGFVKPMFETLLTKAQFIASPDASLLAYDDYDYNTQQHVLKVMEPDAANPLTLTTFSGGGLYPLLWSPDSQLLAFNYNGFAENGPSAEVYISNRDGSRLVTVYKGISVGRLVFSPNGQYLLVEETTSSTGGHLFLINLTTLEQKILEAPGLSTDYDWYAPSWRPSQ